MYDQSTICVAFAGSQRLAFGALADVAAAVNAALEADTNISPLIFTADTSQPIELDLRGTLEDVLSRLASPGSPQAKGPGRPKLGVIPREITLLPRHWEHLGSPASGASAKLRALVEADLRATADTQCQKKGQEALYRFMTAVGGNEARFDEAARALFAGDRAKFEARIVDWPYHIRTHLIYLADAAFPAPKPRQPADFHMICGSTGAGKSTYAKTLSDQIGGQVFSIDVWMVALFWKDSPQPIEFDWAIERVARCEGLMLQTAFEGLARGIPAVLDLGFTKAEQRARIANIAKSAGKSVQLHFVDVPKDERWARVENRNTEKGVTFSMPVDRSMFDFVETLWEAPDEDEMALYDGKRV